MKLAPVVVCALASCALPPDGPVVVTLGTTDPSDPTRFSPLADGALVELNAGNQGGQHVWIEVRASGIVPTHPSVRIDLYRADDGVMIGANNYGGDTWAAVPGATPRVFTSVPLAAQIYSHRYCPLLHGGRVRVRVHLDDQAGHSHDDDVTVALDGWSPTSDPELVTAREQCCANVYDVMCWPDGPPPDAGTSDGGADASDAGTD